MPRTQSTRQAELITPLGADKLLFHEMSAHEGVSQLFEYQVLALVEQETTFKLTDLLGQHAQVDLELPDDNVRYFCGHVTRFSFLGYHGSLRKYLVKLQPWVWFLTQAHNSRIFKDMTVPDIIKSVCAGHGFSGNLIDDRLNADYAPREFCVQYRETDFDFISRLMEDEGIFYFFVHEDNNHKLVLGDDKGAHQTFGNYDEVPWYPPDSHDHRDRDHLDHWEHCQVVRPGTFTARDFNFENPGSKLEETKPYPFELGYEHDGLEVYDYPGGYSALDEPTEKLVQKRIEALQADHELLAGAGNARGLQPGHKFKLTDHQMPDDQNRMYLILSVTHDVKQDDYGSTSSSNSDSFDYRCTLQAIPFSRQFRPARTTPRPIVHGPQTAFVVGDHSQNNKISTDQYGRVWVEFHWDRANNKNKQSSCPVRVAQSWAGNGWGAQFLPRIGHEVVVEFLEGDPDRPIITGAVYNERNKPPYGLTANEHMSGIKTRTVGATPAQADKYNEIRFEDKDGHEKLLFHAEKDMDITVENDRDEVVHNDESVEVKGHRHHTVVKDDTRIVNANDEQNIHGRQNWVVFQDRSGGVRGSETRTVGINQDETVNGTWNKNVIGGITITSPAPISMSSASSITLTAPNLNTTDSSVVSLTTFALGIAWSTNGIELFHSDWRGISMGVTGIGIGLTALNLGYTGVDITGTKLEVTKKMLKLKKEELSLAKKALSMSKEELFLKAASFALRKSGFSMQA